MPRRTLKKRVFGQIYRKRDNPSWYAKCPDLSQPRDEKGRRHYIIRAFPTKKGADGWLMDMRRAFDTGSYKPRPKAERVSLTVLDAIDKFLAAIAGEGRASNTLSEYRRSRRRVAECGLGALDTRLVTGENIEHFIAWRQEPGRTGKVLSSATIAKDVAVLKGAFSRLVRLGVLAKNPVAGIRPSKTKSRPRVTLSKEETSRLVSSCSVRLRPVVLAYLLTGARKNEILMLRWQDIDFESGGISLIRTKVGKAGTIPLHPKLAKVLIAHRGRVSEIKGRAPRGTDWVFPSPRGTAPWQFQLDWKAALKAAGLSDREGLSIKSLRHTFATHFLENGSAVTDLQGLLGHASLATTQIYAKMVDKRARESVCRLNLGLQSGREGEG